MSKRTGSQREARRRKFEQNLAVARALFGKSMSQTRLERIAKAMLGRLAHQQPKQFPLKHERLAELVSRGFNVADYRAWPRGQLNTEELRDMFCEYDALSLRNFTEESGDPDGKSPRLPFMQGQTVWEEILQFCCTHNQQWHTLVNEAIPADQALYAGNIVVLNDTRFALAYSSGGTPRDIDETLDPADAEACSDLQVNVLISKRSSSKIPAELRTVVDMAFEFLPDFRPYTMEFNVYPEPVGMLDRHEIFWEYRGGTTHDLFAMLERAQASGSASELEALVEV